MGFRNNAYAKVWEIKTSQPKYTEVRISISRKNKTNDTYEQEFSGYVRFIGKAHEKIRELIEGDRIVLDSVDVTNRYDKDKKVTYTNCVVFDWSTADSKASNPGSDMAFVNVEAGTEDDNPFA